MPLLRLASLILASLLLAALSALAPGASNPGFSQSHQAPAQASPRAVAVLAQRDADAAVIRPGFSSLRQSRPELARIAGQSIPETGQ